MAINGDERGEETFLAKVGEGWRLTVYEPIRESLDLNIGDLLRVTVRKDKAHACKGV